MTPHPRFFGYGSLVNRATHDYPSAQTATLPGWRRVWVHVAERPVAYLSVEPAPAVSILGLTAEVPGSDWSALDEREYAYARHPALAMSGAAEMPVQVYAVPPENRLPPTRTNPLILSYIDAVVQGFLREYGPDGAAHFFETTHGWNAPIIHDRARPIYPRSQRLTGEEQMVVDAALASLGVSFIAPSP